MIQQGQAARLVCTLLGFPRGQLYRTAAPAPDGAVGVRQALRLAGAWPTYGDRRLTARPRREGRTVTSKRVRRLRTALGIHGRRPVRRQRTTDGNHDLPRLANRVADLEVVRPDQVWVGAIT